ncbi:MAG: BlaI/MecI/CopY family transcriptional regulator [Lachnobacterium sp.]|uniref:BlaI/MecI/CopY family transcriptional regulator n=1 Tax=Agathobacter sp. TaxID=2021311 RepID=UPI00307365DD|nr:BlaI/MecI/CopY family transcriptional regulator [Lachnobacterium sp.]
MARKKSLIKDLSACETVIMKVIWDAVDDIALQQLIVDLREQYGRDYARTTVVTFLGKMAEKGFISTYRVGKHSYVHALKDEKTYKEKLMKDETDFWFGGRPEDAMAAICNSRDISKDEIQKMRQLLDDMDD